jgi:uncharacterized protein
MTRLTFVSEIGAPPAEVYAWHARQGAFAALTPWWAFTRVVREAPSLDPGAQALVRVGPGPFGILWLAEHTDNRPPREFSERQVRGPFRTWEHRHAFLAIPGQAHRSLLRDELTYSLPMGALGVLADRLVVRPFLQRLFAFRHAVTRQSVESRRLERVA